MRSTLTDGTFQAWLIAWGLKRRLESFKEINFCLYTRDLSFRLDSWCWGGFEAWKCMFNSMEILKIWRVDKETWVQYYLVASFLYDSSIKYELLKKFPYWKQTKSLWIIIWTFFRKVSKVYKGQKAPKSKNAFKSGLFSLQRKIVPFLKWKHIKCIPNII